MDNVVAHLLSDAQITISLLEVNVSDVMTALSIVGEMSERRLPIILVCRPDVVADIIRTVRY